MQLFVPTHGKEARSLDFHFRSVVDTNQPSDLCVYLRLLIRAQELLKLLAI